MTLNRTNVETEESSKFVTQMTAGKTARRRDQLLITAFIYSRPHFSFFRTVVFPAPSGLAARSRNVGTPHSAALYSIFFCLAAQPRLRDGGIHSSSVVTELGRRIFPKLREFRPLTSLYVGRVFSQPRSLS